MHKVAQRFVERKGLLLCLILFVFTFGLYIPVLNYKFVKYDDCDYVTDNFHIQQGLNRQSLKWAFTTCRQANWHPVTWISHIIDFQLFGLRAGPHHLVNVLLHCANTVLLFLALKRMTGAVWPSAFVAALFAVHPLHVESVAWIAERKDVLSTFFWLLTMLAYSRYVLRPRIAGYLLVLLFFVLGLMSKPMLVTLPFVLLLLDYWPLERFGKIKTGRIILEKLPLFFLSGASSVITFIVQRSAGAMTDIESLSFKTRFANAIISYVAYTGKMFWPTKLAVLYPHPAGTIPLIKAVLCGAVLLLVTGVFYDFARSKKYLIVGWLWYLGTLVPVIGLVQVGSQAMADRYTYIPLTGLFIIIAWGVNDFAGWIPYKKIFLSLSAVVVLALFAICTRMQLNYWKNSFALFERALNVTGNNWLIHNNYANLLSDEGRYEEALVYFNKALKIKPYSAEVHINLANTLMDLGRIDEAIEHYEKALKFRPDLADGHYNLAVALAKKGDIESAINAYHKTLSFDENHKDALSNLGFLLAQQGHFAQAVQSYQEAIKLRPDDVIAHGRLGLALAELGETDRAIEQFQYVLKYRKDDVEMHCNLGVLLEKKGELTSAIEHYLIALEVEPDNERAARLLKNALSKQQK
jgi:tetratricopeptide (TPR) repeat protein